MAVQGRTTFVSEILKAVFGGSKEDEERAALENQPADPAGAAEKLLSILKDRSERDRRTRKKPHNK